MATSRAPATAADTTVDWLARDFDFVEGLDHLGVQIVSTNIYGRLVPGLSNLTDRARYFGFFSWVLDSFARFAPDKSADGWRTWIRRHEFTLSAAGVLAERDGGVDADQAGGLIGAISARRLTKGGYVDVAAAARIEDGKVPSGTYFQNREGGYAQYYKGPMTALGLLRLDEGRQAPDRVLTTYAGAKIAAAIEGERRFRDLRQVAQSGATVSVSDLAEIGRDVHPAALDLDGAEAALLRAVLLGTDASVCEGQRAANVDQRRRTLALALDYLRLVDKDDWENEVIGFRWAVLEGRLGDGRAWKVPAALQGASIAWAAYCQNELMNYALECIFFAALEVLDEGAISPRMLAHRLADWACGALLRSGTRRARGALPTNVCAAAERSCPPRFEECWEGDGTYTLWEELEHAEGPEERVARAARLLLRVAVDRNRYGSSPPFSTIPQGGDVSGAREIHLASLWERIDRCGDHDTRTFFEDLVLEWVLYRHLRVATRKLASQGDYTFRMRPEEGVLVKCGDFQPTFTNPRLRQAMRMMADVGLVSPDLVTITPQGSRFLKAVT